MFENHCMLMVDGVRLVKHASRPARSTRLSLERRMQPAGSGSPCCSRRTAMRSSSGGSFCSSTSWKMEWERLLAWFMCVSRMARCSSPVCASSSFHLYVRTCMLGASAVCIKGEIAILDAPMRRSAKHSSMLRTRYSERPST